MKLQKTKKALNMIQDFPILSFDAFKLFLH
jgi:hypothetical protein